MIDSSEYIKIQYDQLASNVSQLNNLLISASREDESEDQRKYAIKIAREVISEMRTFLNYAVYEVNRQ